MFEDARLLIDANIYLEFFRFSKDDLDELRKLVELVRTGEIVLYVTEQLRDELRRNRENVLAQSFKSVTDTKPTAQFPQVLRNYERFAKVTAARRSYEAEVEKLLSRAREDAAQRCLPADGVLSELLNLTLDLPISHATIDAAKQRFDRGNPPGKDRSYGDAITWEALLENHPPTISVDLITADRDFVSPLRPAALHEFLETEWTSRKASSVKVYPTLTAFLQEHYLDIRLSTEVASSLAVARLESSGSFAQTHVSIAELEGITDFSADQVQLIVNAALENNQVGSILLDSDVKAFYDRLLATFGDEASEESVNELRSILSEENEAF